MHRDAPFLALVLAAVVLSSACSGQVERPSDPGSPIASPTPTPVPTPTPAPTPMPTPTPCVPACAGLVCGGDGCGGSCGSCKAEESCHVGVCLPAPGCTPACGPSASCQAGACVPNPCTPACGAHVCGDDGCGGGCGTCGPNTSCQSGACIPGHGCTPHCEARDCGDDGCGGSCGVCNSVAACDASIGLCVLNGTPADTQVSWDGACWLLFQLPNDTQVRRYQAMMYTLHASGPVPIEATLYFDRTCEPAGGTDNLNDTGAPAAQGGNIEAFIHHPDEQPTSAVWWLGHSSSGCVDYTNAPDCP